MAQGRFLATGGETAGPVGLDFGAGAQSEFSLCRNLHCQSVAVQHAVPRDMESLHRLEAPVEVGDGQGGKLLDAWHAAGGLRMLQAGPRRATRPPYRRSAGYLG